MLRFKHQWDEPTYINFKNGIYLVESKELVSHSPQYYSRFQLGVDYEIGPHFTPCWDKIRAVYPTQIAHFESFLMASLIQDYSNEGMYFGVGKTGSGKGTIAQIYQIIYGNGIANVQFENLDNDKYGLVPLVGKRIAMNREMTICTWSSRVISFIKDAVTHEGPIDVNKKNRDRFDYLFNVWFIGFTNQLPYLSEGTDRTAWFRRTIIDVYDITQVKDPDFKRLVKLEASAIVSRILQSDYHPIIDAGTNIEELIKHNAELWDYWSDPIKRIILANFEKSVDPNDRLDVYIVWEIIDRLLHEENHIIKYARVQSYTTMYLERIGIRKINRKVYGPIKAIKAEIIQQILDDKQTAEAESEKNFGMINYNDPKYQ